MNERFLEHAEAQAELMRQSRQDDIQRAVAQPGSDTCEDCEEPIPADRRAAAPWATRCIHCAVAHDRRNRLFGARS